VNTSSILFLTRKQQHSSFSVLNKITAANLENTGKTSRKNKLRFAGACVCQGETNRWTQYWHSIHTHPQSIYTQEYLHLQPITLTPTHTQNSIAISIDSFVFDIFTFSYLYFRHFYFRHYSGEFWHTTNTS
jgi:hypothetical protein